MIISHDLADSRCLWLVFFEKIVEGVEAELLRHEELELEAEIHVMVDFL